MNIKEVLTDFYTNPDKAKPLLVTKIMGECTVGVCNRFSKDLSIVANIVKNQFRVAHVDCGQE